MRATKSRLWGDQWVSGQESGFDPKSVVPLQELCVGGCGSTGGCLGGRKFLTKESISQKLLAAGAEENGIAGKNIV